MDAALKSVDGAKAEVMSVDSCLIHSHICCRGDQGHPSDLKRKTGKSSRVVSKTFTSKQI